MEESQTPPTNQAPENPVAPEPPVPEADTPPVSHAVSSAPKKSSKKKKILILLLVLVLIGAAIGGYFYYKHTQAKQTTNATTASVSTGVPAKPLTPQSVVYANRANSTSPLSVYTRPATGGDRKSSITISGKTGTSYYYMQQYKVRGQNVAFTLPDGVYASTDGGVSFKNIHKLDPAKEEKQQAVTSLNFTTDGKKIIIAFLPGFVENTDPTNTIKTMDLDGQNVKDIYTFKAAGVFVYSYDAQKEKLVYATGCYFCDGSPKSPHSLDIKTSIDKELYTINTSTESVSSPVSSVDGQKLIYSVGVVDAQLEEAFGGIGWLGGPPYTIKQYDVSSGQTTTLGTVGTLHEKGADGKFKAYNINVGYTDDLQQPYYSADAKLFVIKNGTPSLTFEASKNIGSIQYVSADSIFASSEATSKGDFTYYRYDIGTKKNTSIYEGDSYTLPMGVTAN